MKRSTCLFVSATCAALFWCGVAMASNPDSETPDGSETPAAAFEYIEPVLDWSGYDGEPAEEYCHFDELSLQYSPEAYDSLVATWYEQNMFSAYDTFFREFIDIDSTATLISDVPDSVYSMRMKAIVSPISLGYNHIIKRYLILYTQNRKEMMGRMVGLSQVYFPLFEEELDKQGLPLELRVLPVVESALNPVAVSRAGATGLWQFMYATGKSYGLEITSFIDQRRDPVASTKAAVRFLKDLYGMFGDWTLAIAAYNCGPGNVGKALKRAGEDAKTFWDVYEYLPRETRGYVPSFIAATYAFAYHKQHGIEAVSPTLPLSTDTITVNCLMHFDQIASTLNVPKETIRALNPQYKLDIIPAQNKEYALTLPQNDVTRYIHHEETILAKDTVYLAQYLQQTPLTNQKTFDITTTTYKVRSGDTLGGIARKHGVTVSQLVSWNRLKNSSAVIRPGQMLEIHK